MRGYVIFDYNFKKNPWKDAQETHKALHTTIRWPQCWGVKWALIVSFVCMGFGDFLKQISFGLHNTCKYFLVWHKETLGRQGHVTGWKWCPWSNSRSVILFWLTELCSVRNYVFLHLVIQGKSYSCFALDLYIFCFYLHSKFSWRFQRKSTKWKRKERLVKAKMSQSLQTWEPQMWF